ncbi:MAG: class I SAM-dependent methyltransferase, partial [Actinomycetota bacterium]
MARRRPPLTPSRRLTFVGEGDFRGVGEEFLGHFHRLGHLQPDEDVLDVGSGIGRMAVPLTGYLSSKGSYEGFDVVPRGVRWCRKHISSRFPNFHFTLLDVRNELYNPRGTRPATEVAFPYEDA